MTQEIVEIEVDGINSTLLEPLKEIQVEENTKLKLKTEFLPFWEEANKVAQTAKSIVVTDASEADKIFTARSLRLSLKNIRIAAKKRHDSLKAESLRTGKAIDAIYNLVKYLTEDAEEHLRKQEDFIKQQKQDRLDKLFSSRETQLRQFDIDPAFYNLMGISEEGFNQLLETTKTAYEQRIAAEKEAEEERIAAEKAEIERQAAVEAELKKLQKEKEARDKLEKIEAEKRAANEHAHQVKLRKERAIKEKIVFDLRQKIEAHEKNEREKIEQIQAAEAVQKKADRDANLAPDKKKLEALAVTITSIEMPEVASKEARAIIAIAIELLNKTSNYIKEKSINL